MTRFWRRENGHDLDGALRAGRPEPRTEFVEALAERLEATESRPVRRPAASMRLVFAVVLGTAIAASAGTVGGLAAGGGGGGGGGAGVSPGVVEELGGGANPFNNQYQGRIPVCHRGRTIFVRPRAALGHLRHGDSLGPCGREFTIPVCHGGQTIQVPIGREVLVHLRHGDRLGPC